MYSMRENLLIVNEAIDYLLTDRSNGSKLSLKLNFNIFSSLRFRKICEVLFYSRSESQRKYSKIDCDFIKTLSIENPLKTNTKN